MFKLVIRYAEAYSTRIGIYWKVRKAQSLFSFVEFLIRRETVDNDFKNWNLYVICITLVSIELSENY